MLGVAAGFGCVLVCGALASHDLPWRDPPGLVPRLLTYTLTHGAETTPDTAFPELRPRQYAVPASILLEAARRGALVLRWDIQAIDWDAYTLEAVITTRLLGFQHDVVLWIVPDETRQSTLFVRSSSRVGPGDLGANSRHIMNLFVMVDGVIPPAFRQQTPQ